MTDIFISYANDDIDRIIPIVKALEDLGWSSWWDRTSIPVGKTWRQFIDEGLAGARCILVIWSRNSLSSEWVHEEADEGKERKILVPVLIDDVRPPRGFGQIQAARLTDWRGESNHSGFQQLRKALNDLLGPTKIPMAVPETPKTKTTGSTAAEARFDKAKRAELTHSDPEPKVTEPPRKNSSKKVGVLIALAVVIAAGAILMFRQEPLKPSKKPEEAQVSKPGTETAAPRPETEKHDAQDTSAIDRTGQYQVDFPSGSEVTLITHRGKGIYKILSARVERRSAEKLGMKISIRLTNTGPLDLGFWSDSFRLLIDGVPRAPINFLNDFVDARSAKEGDIVFEVPVIAINLVLQITYGEDTAAIPLTLKQ